MQIPPSPQLSGIIRHFLFLENTGTGLKKFRLFPDGSSGMVFILNGALLRSAEPLSVYPDRFIYGQLSGYLDLYTMAGTRLLVVSLQPAALMDWLNIPATTFGDEVVELDLVLQRQSSHFLDRISEDNPAAQNIDLVEKMVASNRFHYNTNGSKLVHEALTIIQNNHGVISIDALASAIGCHQRNLERLFKQHIGLSPKKVCTLKRIHHFIREARVDASSARFTSSAIGSGYYDQAHLNHDFKALTGVTPSTYLRNREQLAVNLFRV